MEVEGQEEVQGQGDGRPRSGWGSQEALERRSGRPPARPACAQASPPLTRLGAGALIHAPLAALAVDGEIGLGCACSGALHRRLQRRQRASAAHQSRCRCAGRRRWHRRRRRRRRRLRRRWHWRRRGRRGSSGAVGGGWAARRQHAVERQQGGGDVEAAAGDDLVGAIRHLVHVVDNQLLEVSIPQRHAAAAWRDGAWG